MEHAVADEMNNIACCRLVEYFTQSRNSGLFLHTTHNPLDLGYALGGQSNFCVVCLGNCLEHSGKVP